MKYRVTTRFVFLGTIDVDAQDEDHAKTLVKHWMDATIGNISDSGDCRILDWDIDQHATEIETEDVEEV